MNLQKPKTGSNQHKYGYLNENIKRKNFMKSFKSVNLTEYYRYKMFVNSHMKLER